MNAKQYGLYQDLSAMVDKIVSKKFVFLIKKASSLFLKMMVEFELMTVSGSSFQNGTTLLLKKFSRGSQFYINCLSIPWYAPRTLTAGPFDRSAGLVLIGLTQLTMLSLL